MTWSPMQKSVAAVMMVTAGATGPMAQPPVAAKLPDLAALKALSAAGDLGDHVLFKLDEASVKGGLKYRAEAAAAVAKILGCADDAARLFRSAGKHEPRHEAAGLHLWYRVTCEEPFHAISQFSVSGDSAAAAVAIIEPELRAAPSVQSNDPMLDQQSHYATINLFEAWEVERGSPDVVVQVVDTGLDLAHPDMQNNLWVNPGEICGNGVDDDDNGFVDDCHGYNHAEDSPSELLGAGSHGTHCAGTIAADTDNGVGVAGVAGGSPDSSGVSLMISVVFGATTVGGFAEALVYGADNGARISSNSWGYTGPGFIEQSIVDAIDYYNDATRNAAEQEGVVVFAAGNSNSEADFYPGYYDGVISVAAVDDNGVRASFSNYGDWIDISAPGVDVLSTTMVTENQGYSYYSGTSMACPHVAGVFALGLSASPATSKAALLSCAYDTAAAIDSINGGYAGKLGAGLVDAHAFVECAKFGAPSPAPTHSVAPTTVAPTTKPSFSVAPTEACGACDQTLELIVITDNYSAETQWTLAHTPSAPDCVVAGAEGGPYPDAGATYSHVLSQQICAGETYTFRITDAYGDGICCSWGQGSYTLVLNGDEIHSGGDFAAADEFVFVAPHVEFAPTPRPTAQPIAAPTPRPTAQPIAAPTPLPADDAADDVAGEPLLPPTDVKVYSHKKMGSAALVSWTPSADATQYVVQFKLTGDTSDWVEDTPSGGAQISTEWDGRAYYALAHAQIECGERFKVRVAHRDSAGMLGEFGELAKAKKRKC